MKKYSFGEMAYGSFPYLGADGAKDRWVFVLADHGDMVIVAYCTTNPEWPGSVRLGQVADHKVCNLVPYRWEAIQKERFVTHKGVFRANLDNPDVLPAIGVFAKNGKYDGYSQEILEEARRQRDYVVARRAKRDAKAPRPR